MGFCQVLNQAIDPSTLSEPGSSRVSLAQPHWMQRPSDFH